MMRTFGGTTQHPAPADVWTYPQVETALCMWEAVCDLMSAGHAKTKAGEDPGETYRELEQLFDGSGSFTMRAAVASLADDCDGAWRAADALHPGGYPDSFDFDFCPAFIKGAIDSGLLGKAVDAQYGIHDPVPFAVGREQSQQAYEFYEQTGDERLRTVM